MERYAILDGYEIVPTDDVLEWAYWYDSHTDERTVQQTHLEDGTLVSTIFLGLNHAWRPEQPPQWFETMVFFTDPDHTCNGYEERYATYEEAIVGHNAVLAKVKANQC